MLIEEFPSNEDFIDFDKEKIEKNFKTDKLLEECGHFWNIKSSRCISLNLH